MRHLFQCANYSLIRFSSFSHIFHPFVCLSGTIQVSKYRLICTRVKVASSSSRYIRNNFEWGGISNSLRHWTIELQHIFSLWWEQAPFVLTRPFTLLVRGPQTLCKCVQAEYPLRRLIVTLYKAKGWEKKSMSKLKNIKCNIWAIEKKAAIAVSCRTNLGWTIRLYHWTKPITKYIN